jgi:hypothetical protein
MGATYDGCTPQVSLRPTDDAHRDLWRQGAAGMATGASSRVRPGSVNKDLVVQALLLVGAHFVAATTESCVLAVLGVPLRGRSPRRGRRPDPSDLLQVGRRLRNGSPGRYSPPRCCLLFRSAAVRGQRRPCSWLHRKDVGRSPARSTPQRSNRSAARSNRSPGRPNRSRACRAGSSSPGRFANPWPSKRRSRGALAGDAVEFVTARPHEVRAVEKGSQECVTC